MDYLNDIMKRIMGPYQLQGFQPEQRQPQGNDRMIDYIRKRLLGRETDSRLEAQTGGRPTSTNQMLDALMADPGQSAQEQPSAGGRVVDEAMQQHIEETANQPVGGGAAVAQTTTRPITVSGGVGSSSGIGGGSSTGAYGIGGGSSSGYSIGGKRRR